MELILAIVVVAAVVFFGALISAGNERQRKAIDSLRQQVELWAIQDLRIKREKLARNVEMANPTEWLNKTITKAYGLDLHLQPIEFFDHPQALLCTSTDGINKVLLTPLSPTEVRQMKQTRRSRLSQYGENHPLLSLPRHVPVYEFSVLNSSLLFDLELPLAWTTLTQHPTPNLERLWMYKLT